MDPLDIVLIVSSVAITGFVGFSLVMQYRYATQLFDMLRFYPFLTLIPMILWFLPAFVWPWPTTSLTTFWVCTIMATICLFLELFATWWKEEYSIDKFRDLMITISKERYSVITFDEYESGLINQEKVNVILRHDVDISLPRTIKMAEVQAELGIPATYFFRLHAEKYCFEEAVPVIKKLVDDGFKIGLHYETLSVAKGDKKKAIELLGKDIEKLREIAPMGVVAAHGQKEYKNREIWENVDKEALQISSAYDVQSDMYLSDAGGKRLKDKKVLYRFNRLYEAKVGQIVQVLIHPDWWN
ncbi:MAG: hypothetical protein ACFFF9_13600 [Candidatus Thorarchaeota archaeon]